MVAITVAHLQVLQKNPQGRGIVSPPNGSVSEHRALNIVELGVPGAFTRYDNGRQSELIGRYVNNQAVQLKPCMGCPITVAPLAALARREGHSHPETIFEEKGRDFRHRAAATARKILEWNW